LSRPTDSPRVSHRLRGALVSSSRGLPPI